MNIAINGFGRIGRVFTRIASQNSDINIVAINDLSDINILYHLLKYDSIHGKFKADIKLNEKAISINDKQILFFQESNPQMLPWKDLNVDVVIESTGRFLTKELSQKHIYAGAKKVILSAPSKSSEIKTICYGINEDDLCIDDLIISNASCTTNSLAPLIKVLKGICEIQNIYVSTVHSYTNDQNLHDAPHRDLRRARAATNSIIPTSTGAANAIVKLFPDLYKKIGAMAIRIPVIDGSFTDLTCVVDKEISKEDINKAFKIASENNLKNVLEYNSDPIVSCDIIGNPHSSIYNSDLTDSIGNMIKITAWYDNEYGYSSRLVDLSLFLKKFI